jgi:formamidopyrimidine-DNA glycosylase
MPEGDTVWRAARTLHSALAGKTVLAFTSSLPAITIASRRLGVVEARSTYFCPDWQRATSHAPEG